MTLSTILLLKAAVVGVMIVLAAIACDVEPAWLTWDEVRRRVYDIAPYVAVLVLVYAFNRGSHTVGQRLSLLIGRDITRDLYALEGNFVATLQEIIPYRFAGYFTFFYLFGFAFVLAFPVVAYFAHPSRRYLKELFAAYAVNYAAGATCYLFFIAYGPRNTIVQVREPMYELYPQVVALTGSINSSANVFPSLHVSLVVTVVLLAWRTRDVYPRWPWLATLVTIHVVVATMFLGIHWFVDVLAGIGAAAVSVLVALYAVRYVDGVENEPEIAVRDGYP